MLHYIVDCLKEPDYQKKYNGKRCKHGHGNFKSRSSRKGSLPKGDALVHGGEVFNVQRRRCAMDLEEAIGILSIFYLYSIFY